MKVDDLQKIPIAQIIEMKDLQIEIGDKTPLVDLDSISGVLKIEGRSIPENAQEFYRPILSWLDHYLNFPAEETVLYLNLEYFNTSSSKIILDIMMRLKKNHLKGKKVVVRWLYQEEDEEMLEAGNDYASLIEIPFQIESFV
jgi:hypothetical protein